MRTSKIPPLTELMPYTSSRSLAAERFAVTEKTIIRWMKQYELYQPVRNCKSNKLNTEKAHEIRRLYREGTTVNKLSADFQVTPSSIGRILHNLTYRESREVADVSVIYNHVAEMGIRGG